MTAMTMQDAEPVATAVVGFRQWTQRDGLLCSMMLTPSACRIQDGKLGHVVWPAGEPMIAVSCCPDSPEKHPRIGASTWSGRCTCGLYACKDIRDAAPNVIHELSRIGVEYYPHSGQHRYAVGFVVMWGRIVEHEKGYRSQYAKPVALLDSKYYRGGREVSDDYALPLLSAAELLDYAGWWAS